MCLGINFEVDNWNTKWYLSIYFSEQELADRASAKLSHMQSYLGEAFNSNLDIVLHEAQVLFYWC